MKVNKLLFRFLDNWHHLGVEKRNEAGKRLTSVAEHITNDPFNTNYHAILPLFLGFIKYLDILWENVSYK